ncbi:MAG: TetR family transcriptional regulator C-terminal domain-containing protein [SAR202 cluster bacterium]|nr:TetR family transcriptional regulator C-terminal domain-containing protein [SAR202 cluster bacterium]
MKRLNLRVANKKTSNLKLISSAIKNISEKGINETTMSDVSQGAGLSQGIVNFHFKSKELLLIETLKYVSNEYLASFQTSLKKSGSDPRKKIIAIINNDFSKKICSRDKVALWFTFFSEVKFKPAYHQICKERDLYYQKITEDIFRKLINLEKSKISLTNVSNGLQALVMGLWLDQLEDPDTFKRKKAKEICFDYVKSYIPKQFKDIL